MKGAGSSRRQQARRATESVACRRAEVVPLSPINCCPRVPRCSVCETHDPTGEPSAVNPPAGFGERRLATGLRRGVRHRHSESRRQQLPPIAYRYRASCRLYNFPSVSERQHVGLPILARKLLRTGALLTGHGFSDEFLVVPGTVIALSGGDVKPGIGLYIVFRAS